MTTAKGPTPTLYSFLKMDAFCISIQQGKICNVGLAEMCLQVKKLNYGSKILLLAIIVLLPPTVKTSMVIQPLLGHFKRCSRLHLTLNFYKYFECVSSLSKFISFNRVLRFIEQAVLRQYYYLPVKETNLLEADYKKYQCCTPGEQTRYQDDSSVMN